MQVYGPTRSGGECYTGLVKIMITLIDYFYINDLKDRIRTVVSSIPREMYVRAVKGTVSRWLLCVKHGSEQVETVL
jgi:hypothetical protein